MEKEEKQVKTKKEYMLEYNQTKLGKKYRKWVIIATVIFAIAALFEIYMFIDTIFEINKLSVQTKDDIDTIFTYIILASLIFDGIYYGGISQYMEDRK